MKNVGVPFTPLRTPPRKSAADLGRVFAVYQRIAQIRFGQTKGSGQREQQRQAEAILVLVDAIVHLPEPAVRAGVFGALGGAFGVGVDLSHRKMAKDESQPLAEMFPHELDDRMRQSAVAALVVAVFDQRDRRVRPARGYDQPA